MKSKEIQNLIVDTKPEHMHHFLRMILQLQMNDYKYHYLFTTFDIETFDLEDFKYNFVNITAFRLVDADDLGVRSILRDMERYQPAGNTILNKSRIIQKHALTLSLRSIVIEFKMLSAFFSTDVRIIEAFSRANCQTPLYRREQPVRIVDSQTTW
ncbi:Glutamate receptor, ionotropic kainate 1 [Camponotus floridanus]|uniref:Glutamate receptor, ionotropic kainate 1 n=1 Tax=Camponotus floridanus TaxID=104421 RepID=E2AK27_CAMFO|nr:Glutamate receptor, ionotropic kainate 1 [Camponotus floridanus]